MLRRYLSWALLLLGLWALGAHAHEFRRMDAWAWVALAALAAAPLLGLRRMPALRWLVASLPFWVFGNAVEWILLVAVGLTVTSMVVAGVLPTLVGRRVNRPAREPLAHLSPGPLVPVAPRLFTGGQRSRLLAYLARGFLVLAGVLFALIGVGRASDEVAALVVAAIIISATFAFGNWFADRVRLRVDEVGVHGRTLFVEHTAKWSDITGLRLRYLFLPGFGARLVYYVVESARHEVAFPSSMHGATDLQAIIEAATGLKWAEPEITPNM